MKDLRDGSKHLPSITRAETMRRRKTYTLVDM
jgi:hypothetical protein